MDFNLNLGCIDEGNLSEISEDKLYFKWSLVKESACPIIK